MESLFETLASTNNMVRINYGDGMIIIEGDIISTERFDDGLVLSFDNGTEYFISSCYNQLVNSYSEDGVYTLLDSVHGATVSIEISPI